MADTEGEERTEDATETRREDFRKRGQIAQTRELNSVLILLGAALVFWGLGRYFLSQLLEILSVSLTEQIVVAARQGDWKPAAVILFQRAAMVVAPMLGMSFVIGIVGTVVQTGFIYNEEALSPQWERINPIDGFKRLISLRSVVEAIKAMFKIAAILMVLYFVVRSELKSLPYLASLKTGDVLIYVGSIVVQVLGVVGAMMAAIAAIDYFYQWWDLEKRMRMTKQEVKEEMRSREGDPLIKARIRRIQKEISNRRMMEKVPKANVIITNPTHIAVALRYDENMVAPQLIAKGAGAIAEKIKAIAREHRIPVIENKPLARAIFKTMKLGQTIPRELYKAVAKVLSYVYRLKNKAVS